MGQSVNANACARDKKKKDESVNIHVKDVFVNSNLHDTIGCKKDNRFLYNARSGDFSLSDECASERNFRRGRKRRHQTHAPYIPAPPGDVRRARDGDESGDKKKPARVTGTGVARIDRRHHADVHSGATWTREKREGKKTNERNETGGRKMDRGKRRHRCLAHHFW